MAENRELALVLRLVSDQFRSELKASGGALGEFNRFISDWKTQLTAASGALFAIAKSTANYGEELLKSSQKTGVTVQAYAGMQYAAHLADLSNEQFAQGLKFLSVNMVEAGRNTGDGEQLFRRLGVSATDAAGKLRPTEAVLLDVAEAFASAQDGAGKSEMAVKLFGKAGLDLIPFLNQGKTGIKELMDEAGRLGLVMSQEDAAAAGLFNDELKKLASEARGMTFAVGKELIPIMTDLFKLFRSFELGGGLKQGLDIVRGSVVELTVAFKALQAMAQFFSGTGKDSMSLDQFRGRMDELNIERKRKVFAIDHPNVVTPAGGGSSAGSASPKGQISELADQEKLGKALVEIFKSQNAALEIRNKLVQEGTNEFQLAFERQEQFRKEDEAEQEKRGAMIVEQTSMQVKIRDESLAKERAGFIENAQAWIAYHDQVGGSTELRYQKELDLTRATLAQELQLTQEEAGQLLQAWETHESEKAELILSKTTLTTQQRETIELQSLKRLAEAQERASNDIVAGWAKGMAAYVRQTGNGFNLGTDMARRTAQMMEAGFRTFFFDAMEGRIKGLKDVFKSLLDFAKQIMSQVMAQIAVAGILKGVSAGFGSTGTGAADYSKTNFFTAANGGVGSFGAGSLGILHGIEAVVPLPDGRSIPVMMKSMGAPSGGGDITFVVNNYSDAKVEQPQRSQSPDGRQQITMLIKQVVKSGFAEGAFDQDMNRFGNKPKPFGR